MNIEELIKTLNLNPHPEGGYYRETYRSKEIVLNHENKKRNLSTTIYYLLKDNDKSMFHRIKSDETWFFHQGNPLEIVCIIKGEVKTIVLGNEIKRGEVPQILIPANTWFGANIKDNKGYSLVSCVVSPGFDFEDFELAKKEDLIKEYPRLKETIKLFVK